MEVPRKNVIRLI